MNKHLLWFLCLLLLPAVSAYTIQGDSVIQENAYVKLNVTPHTSMTPTRIYEQFFTVNSKVNQPGDLCVAYAFDYPIEAGRVWLEVPHNITVERKNETCTPLDPAPAGLADQANCTEVRWNETVATTRWQEVTSSFESTTYSGRRVYYNAVPLGFAPFESHRWKIIYKPDAREDGKWEMFTWNTRNGICVDAITDPNNRNFLLEMDPWYDSTWQYRINVTINSSRVAENVNNFPVFLDLSRFPASFFGNITNSGSDIRITLADQITEVPREVVYVNKTSLQGEVWFKGNLSSSTDTVFWVYYGNSAASDYSKSHTYGGCNVWTGYAAVWHLQEDIADAAPETKDSTCNGNNGTLSSTQRVVTKLGLGQRFDDDNSVIVFPDHASLEPDGDMTISLYINVTGDPNDGRYANTGPIGKCCSNLQYLIQNPDGAVTWTNTMTHGTRQDAHGTSIPTANLSYWIGAQYHSNKSAMMYVNGVAEAATSANTGNLNTGTSELSIGRYQRDTPSVAFNPAVITEARIDTNHRTANWMLTEYRMLDNSATFMRVGSGQQNVVMVLSNITPAANVLIIDAQANATSDITRFEYHIFRNGALLAQGNVTGTYAGMNTYNILNYTVNNSATYIVGLRAEDASGVLSDWLNSSGVLVNISPIVISSSMRALHDLANATFNVTVTDPNNSTLSSVIMRFFRNGTMVYNQTNLTVPNGTTLLYEINEANFTTSDVINASFTVDDGGEISINYTTSKTISQSPPVINSYSISPTIATVSVDSVLITLNATGTSPLDSAVVQITDPNSLVTNLSLTLSNGVYTRSYIPSVVGTYQTVAFINNSAGNISASDQVNFSSGTAAAPPAAGGGGGGGGDNPLFRPQNVAGNFSLESPLIDRGLLFMRSFNENPVTFDVRISANKVIKSCSADAPLQCKVVDNGTAMVISYTEHSHDQFQRLIRGKVKAISSTNDVYTTQTTFRIINLGYAFGEQSSKEAPEFFTTFPYILRVDSDGMIHGVRLVFLASIVLIGIIITFIYLVWRKGK